MIIFACKKSFSDHFKPPIEYQWSQSQWRNVPKHLQEQWLISTLAITLLCDRQSAWKCELWSTRAINYTFFELSKKFDNGFDDLKRAEMFGKFEKSRKTNLLSYNSSLFCSVSFPNKSLYIYSILCLLLLFYLSIGIRYTCVRTICIYVDYMQMSMKICLKVIYLMVLNFLKIWFACICHDHWAHMMGSRSMPLQTRIGCLAFLRIYADENQSSRSNLPNIFSAFVYWKMPPWSPLKWIYT